MKAKFRQTLSFLLAFTLSFTPLANVFAKDDINLDKSELNDLRKSQIETIEEVKKDDDADVRVVVELEGKSVLEEANDMGVEIDDLDENSISKMEDDILDQQQEVKDQFEEENIKTASKIDDEVEADGVYTKAFNGFATYVKAKDIEKIEKIDQVKTVHPVNEYNRPDVTINMDTSNDMVMSKQAWDLSYKGEGMVVSIIDSGIDPSHKDFNIDEGVEVSLTEEKVNEIKQEKNLPGSYYTQKVPYAYNYYDLSDNIKDIGESQHGQHVAGTVAANGEIKGVAPNAQLLGMKVFSDDYLYATTFSDIYMQAIEDSISLGADVINMSLGSVAGTYVESTLEDVALKNATENGIVCAIAAGNEHTIIDGLTNFSDIFTGEYPYPYAKNPDIGTLGSPSVYPWSLSVASIDNTHVKSHKIVYTIDGEEYEAATNPASGAPHAWEVFPEGVTADQIVDVKASEDGVPGDLESFENTDVEGKVCMVERGNTFVDTMTNAMNHGAAAVIIYNNEREDSESLINMAGGDIAEIPFMMIGRKAGLDIVNNLDKDLKLEFPEDMITQENPTGNQVSSFSSWGTTPELQIKPEISAPGGMIYSTQNDNKYTTMSGTSMATPHVAGGAALINERLKREDSPFGKLTPDERSHLAKILLMNTSDVLKDSDGLSYLVRQQGSGMMNLEKALQTEVYIVEKESGEAKAELLDFDDTTIEMTFSLINVSDSDKTFSIDCDLLTDLTEEANGRVYNLEYPKALDFELKSDKEITVAANSTLDTTVVIDFKKAVDNKQIDKNSFVEGFVYFNSEGDVDLSVPFMGFYGDWDEPSLLDLPANNLNDDDISNDPMFKVTGLVAMDKNKSVFDLTSDPAYFNPDGEYNQVAFRGSVLRNLDRIEFSIEDEQGNELYYIGRTDSRRKINNMASGQYPFTVFTEGLWDGRINNDTLEEGQNVFYTVKAYRTKDSKPQVMRFELSVDKDEPELVEKNYSENSLMIKAKDQTSGIKDFVVINLIDFLTRQYQKAQFFDAEDVLVNGNLNDGEFKLEFSKGLYDGQYVILAEDFAGNMVSDSFEVTKDEARLLAPKVDPVYTTSETITGTASQQGEISVRVKDGEEEKEIASGEVKEDLTFEIPIEQQQKGTKLYVYLINDRKESDPAVVEVDENRMKPVEISTKVDSNTTKIVGNALRANVEVSMLKKEGEDYIPLYTTMSNENGEFTFEFDKPFEAGTILAFWAHDPKYDITSKATEVEVKEYKERELSEFGQAQLLILRPDLLTGYKGDVPFEGSLFGWENLDSLTFGDKEISFEQKDGSVINPQNGNEIFYGPHFDFNDSLSLEEGYHDEKLTARDGENEFSVIRRFYVDNTNPQLSLTDGNEVFTTNDYDEFTIYTDKESLAVDFTMKDNLNVMYLWKENGMIKASDITPFEGFDAVNIEDSVTDILYLDKGDNVYNYTLYDVADNTATVKLNVIRTDKTLLNVLIDRIKAMVNKPEELEASLQSAIEVLDNEYATNDDIEQAIELLENSLEELPEEPIIYGANDFDVYVGENVDRERLLENIIAYDYQDGDLTDKVEVDPESIDTSEAKEVEVVYSVLDSDGYPAAHSINVRVLEKPKDPVDFSKLRELILEAMNVSENEYTKSSVEDVLAHAKLSIEYLSDEYSQEEIDEQTNRLQSMLDNLVYIGDLKALVLKSSRIEPDDYSKESAERFIEAYENAKKVLEDPNANVNDVEEAMYQLRDAISKLDEKVEVDKTELKELYDKWSNEDLEKYDDKSKKELEEALMLAQTVLNDENASQEAVDNALDLLKDKIANLKEKEKEEVSADKRQLQQLFDKSNDLNKSDYTKESFEKLEKAKQDAKAALDNEKASQEEVDNALNNLLDAFIGLVKNEQVKEDVESEDSNDILETDPSNGDQVSEKPEEKPVEKEEIDKTKLEELFEKAKKLDMREYEKESREKMAIALANAKEVLDNKKADKDLIEDAYKLLSDTMNALKKLELEKSKEDPKTSDDIISKEDKKSDSNKKELSAENKSSNKKDSKVKVFEDNSNDPVLKAKSNASKDKSSLSSSGSKGGSSNKKGSKNAKTGVLLPVGAISTLLAASALLLVTRRKK
ncbi:MAG: S8 family serine peptidase [Tissierellia bacterium]|nr:S8 family serine peptidase [Tissierellia bacterium]